MKAIGIVSTAALSLVLGIAAPLYAQEPQHEEQKDKQEEKAKPAKAEEKAKPAQAEEKAKPAQAEEKHAQPEEKKAEQEKPAQHEEKQAQQEKANQHEEQAQKGKEQEEHHQQQAQHEGRGRITEAHFHSDFGREHVFVINHPVIVEGSPRFQYGGYWFGYGQPWPAGWYYTDNVYVDYVDGGYFLYNPVHPGIRLSINLF